MITKVDLTVTLLKAVFSVIWINTTVGTFRASVSWGAFCQNERKIEQAHIPHAPTLPENAVYNEWQFQALVTSNRTENQFHPSCKK